MMDPLWIRCTFLLLTAAGRHLGTLGCKSKKYRFFFFSQNNKQQLCSFDLKATDVF